MSWSIEVTGTKAGVVKKVTEQLDKSAASYAGKAEREDVLTAKTTILFLVEKLDLSTDGYWDWNGVVVKANGTHSTNDKGVVAASMQISVARTVLALD